MFDSKTGRLFIFLWFWHALVLPFSDCLKPVAAKDHLKHRDEVEEDFPYKNTRLPRNISPHTYRVYLHANLTTFKVKGRVGILIYCIKETRQIILHSKDNIITRVTVSTGNVRDLERMENSTDNDRIIKIKMRKESKKLEILLLELEQPLKTQGWYTLIISFKGKLESNLDGFYKSTYKTKTGETRHIATTQFQATAARSAFPCFDEPDMKAKFQINLVREARHVALSNMPIEKTVTRNNGLLEDQFKESVKMSTYLVAFVICDFKYKEATTKGGVKVRVWAPEDQIDQAEIAIDAAPKILDHYNEFFGVPFPLPKQDLVAIPDFSAGAMENWGLITYRETALLYDPKKSSTSHKQWVVVVIAHELAHQWFGNLVTMKWWNDLWLNEGFASYVEFLGTSHYNSSWKMMDQFTVEDIHGSMELDALSNSHPISVDVDNPSQISELFDQISYHKGASVIRMLANFIGKTAFHSGLKHYLERHRYDNAETDDLWQELAKTSSVDVKNVMDTWTRQMGFPLVTIVRDPENPDTAIATQEHFLEDPSASVLTTSPFNYKWEVPLTYMMKSGTKTTRNTIKWMPKNGAPVKFPWTQADGWIKGNIKSYGYYRCNYDESNWRALARQLKEDHTVFSAIDRANLIDDACAIARAEKLNQILALELTTYMEKETEYVPFVTALSCLGKIGATLDERPGHKYYKAYIVKILKPVMAKLGWEDTGSHLNKKLREKVLYSAVENGDENAINKLKEMFKGWKENDNELPANLMNSVHLAGIKYGAQEDWDFVWEKQTSSHVAIEKSNLINTLTTTKDVRLLRRYLNYAIDDSKIRQQDGATVIVLIGRNTAGRQLAWDFLKRKWDVLFERYGESSYDFSDLLKSVGGRFTTQEKLNEVKAFYESHDMASGQRAAKQAIEEIKSNIDWLKKHEQEVVDWFKSKTPN